MRPPLKIIAAGVTSRKTNIIILVFHRGAALADCPFYKMVTLCGFRFLKSESGCSTAASCFRRSRLGEKPRQLCML